MNASMNRVGSLHPELEAFASTRRKTRSIHQTGLLRVAVMVMSVAAVARLGYEFCRLVWQTRPMGAIDLRTLRGQSIAWIGVIDINVQRSGSVYPPASYRPFWLAVSWPEETAARGVWAASTLLMMAWLIYIVIDAVRPETRLESLFLGLIPLSAYAAGATIGNGQIALHVRR